ncbi:folate-binding protein, partial [Mycobacterium tuberculosis]|nr:folate-binding protein [Mycobacterium tuberculosis]
EYLRKMVFWSEVTPSDADLAVLSLLGPRLADQTILDALGVDALPAELSAVPLDGGFVRRMPGTPAGSVELDLVVPRGDAGDWRNRLSQAGVRPGGV